MAYLNAQVTITKCQDFCLKKVVAVVVVVASVFVLNPDKTSL